MFTQSFFNAASFTKPPVGGTALCVLSTTGG
jgi:hypothetical protein